MDRICREWTPIVRNSWRASRASPSPWGEGWGEGGPNKQTTDDTDDTDIGRLDYQWTGSAENGHQSCGIAGGRRALLPLPGERAGVRADQFIDPNIQHRTWNIEHGTLNWRRVFPPLPGEGAGVRAGQASQPQMDTNEHELCLVARASRPCISVRTNRNRNSRAGRPCHYGPPEFSRRLRELSQTVVRMNANRYEGRGVTGRRRALLPLSRGRGPG